MRNLIPSKLWIFIIWWRKYYFIPSVPGQTHTPHFHSSPRESLEPDNEDCSKLVHIMKYIRYTRNLPLILSDNRSIILKRRIYRSFVVHPNIRRQTSGGISTGWAFPIVSSINQKLNTQSSTKNQILAVDNCILVVLWTRYGLEAQGYDVF